MNSKVAFLLEDDASEEAPEVTITGKSKAEKLSPLSLLKEAVSGFEKVKGQNLAIVRIISEGFGNSRDNHYYPAKTLEASVPIFKGAKVFADHPTQEESRKRPERSINDLCGVIRETWYDPQQKAVMGKMQVLRAWLWELVQNAPDSVAMSINAKANVNPGTVQGKAASIVESITQAFSVDVVTFAGARGGVVGVLESDPSAYQFSEEEQREVDKAMFEGLTVAQLREARPDLYDAFVKEAATEAAKSGTKPDANQAPQGVTEAQLKEAISAAVKPYEERLGQAAARISAQDRQLNVGTAFTEVSTLVSQAGIPDLAKAKVLKGYKNVTFGETVPDATYKTIEELREAVAADIKWEEEYVKALQQGNRNINGGNTPAAGDAEKTGAQRIASAIGDFDKLMESWGGAPTPARDTSGTTTVVLDSKKVADQLAAQLGLGDKK